MRSFLKILTLLATISAIIALSLIAYDFINSRRAFPSNTYIAGVDFSSLSYEEAVAKLEKYTASMLFDPVITLQAENRLYSFPPEKLGVHILTRKTIDNAFRLTHKSFLESFSERLTVEAISAPLILGIKEGQLRAAFETLAAEINTLSKEATMSFYEKTGGYNIRPETIGKKVNIWKNMESFRAWLKRGEEIYPVAIEYSQPLITEAALREHPPVYRLSAYTTYYGKHDSPNRIHNIKLVSSWIDNTLLMPGDSFSVADILGDTSEEQGFKEAFVIIKGELVPLLGGGSCQIATTLYNAASLADLKVLERRNHSFYFNIYPLGRDAAVYPGQVDFRFKNDTPYPILIKSVATDRSLSFRLYGTPGRKRVRFSETSLYGKDETGKYVPMPLTEIIEKDLSFKTKVVRSVYEGRKLLRQDTILSHYKLYGDKENVPIRRPEPR